MLGIEMTVVIYHQLFTISYLPSVIYHLFISILLANNVIPRVYKKPRCVFRSPLMKTLDWSVETLGRECNSTGLCIHFNKTRVARET